MELKDFIARIPGFHSMSASDRITIICWYLHRHRDKEVVDNDTLRKSFREIHDEPPDVTIYLPRMAAKKPAIVLKSRGGYRLEGAALRRLDAKYRDHPTVAAVTQVLSSLPEKLPSVTERVFLQEALNCYRVSAFRAAIVMSWNLTFDHLCRWILAESHRLDAFNAVSATKYPRKAVKVAEFDDFNELKESETIEICRTADLVSKGMADILREKLKRRNFAAHPSSQIMTQHQADDMITDLINNVVLVLAP
jgi:hypothetical protein